jgi:hypothetical protein
VGIQFSLYGLTPQKLYSEGDVCLCVCARAWVQEPRDDKCAYNRNSLWNCSARERLFVSVCWWISRSEETDQSRFWIWWKVKLRMKLRFRSGNGRKFSGPSKTLLRRTKLRKFQIGRTELRECVVCKYCVWYHAVYPPAEGCNLKCFAFF